MKDNIPCVVRNIWGAFVVLEVYVYCSQNLVDVISNINHVEHYSCLVFLLSHVLVSNKSNLILGPNRIAKSDIVLDDTQ